MIDKHQIQKLRIEHGFSQEYLAEKLEVSRPTYIRLERGEKELTVSQVRTVETLYNLGEGKLFEARESRPAYEVVLPELPAPRPKEPFMRISIPQNRVDKFKEVLLYILGKIGARPNVGETVIYKLLYFVDFDYYEKYEEQFIGAKYQKNNFGPAPVEFQKITESMMAADELEQVRSKYYQHEQKKYLPLREPDLGRLTAREVKHIDEVLARLGDKSARELTDYSHRDVPWLGAKDGEILNYEAVFYRTAETSVRRYEENAD